jgi:uncharacterized protein (TIGR02217 family)
MSITVLSDVVVPNEAIQEGIRGKQMRRNDRAELLSGAKQINVGWTRTRREYELGIVPMLRSSWQQIEALHEITEGGAYGMLLEDPKDSGVSVAEGVVAELTATTFQLYKRYTHTTSARYKDRKITRPQAASAVRPIRSTSRGAAASTCRCTSRAT